MFSISSLRCFSPSPCLEGPIYDSGMPTRLMVTIKICKPVDIKFGLGSDDVITTYDKLYRFFNVLAVAVLG